MHSPCPFPLCKAVSGRRCCAGEEQDWPWRGVVKRWRCPGFLLWKVNNAPDPSVCLRFVRKSFLMTSLRVSAVSFKFRQCLEGRTSVKMNNNDNLTRSPANFTFKSNFSKASCTIINARAIYSSSKEEGWREDLENFGISAACYQNAICTEAEAINSDADRDVTSPEGGVVF